MTVLSRREGTSVAYSCACRSLGRFCRDLFDRAQSLTSGGCEGWRYAPVAARSLSRLRAGLLRLAPARPGLSFQGRLRPFFPVIAASRACSYRGEIFTSFHQFSPVFTSSWAAVEVNAVQTKCELYWGAIADLSPKDDMTVEKVSLAVLAVLGVVGLAYFIATTLEVLPIISAS
jgi:hypothetical protein